MKVAVVGAGISGVVTGAHLMRAGLDITVFERNDAAGGVWSDPLPRSVPWILMYLRLYDERLPPEPSYPANKPSEGDSITRRNFLHRQTSQNGLREHLFTEHLQHAPPGSGTNAWFTRYLLHRTNST